MSNEAEGTAGPSIEAKRALLARLRRDQAATPSLSGQRVHRLVESRARQAPGAIAVRSGGRELTFGELNERANRLAHHLRARGVGPDILVGLCCDRTPEMVVGLLGVLKAGGAYVPIDPTYPAERLSFLLDDTRAAVLLTQESLLDRIPETTAAILCLDRDWPQVEGASGDDPADMTDPENLAYLIFTSGSTGRPKGVMVTHRGLSNYLAWAVRAYAVGDGNGAPVHSSVSFDLTVTSLLAPLVAGRRVDLLPDGPGVEALADALSGRPDYSLVKLTPAHLQLLGERLAPEEAAGAARAFVIGGEPLTGEQVAFWLEHAPETKLVNEYGPTETVVGCCVYTVPPGPAAPGPIPIGKPIASTQLLILDPRMQPVPAGVAGELYIGGAGLARGYLRRPSLTAETFVPNPYSREPGVRLYRTGDLARWRSDGEMEFLGRIDDQVKIRGFRIEPGEVQSALMRHPAVSQAVVVAREDTPGEKRLVGYVVAAPGGEVGDAELREFVKGSLPEYMVPSVVVVLESLPLTSNGKVDRRALPPPDQARTPTAARYVAPRGPIEEAVAGLLAEMLGYERVGIHDNFFDLGGHSIAATRVVARLRDMFSVEPSLRDFFDSPTPAGLAAIIERSLRTGAGLDAPPIVPVGRDGTSLPTSFAQQRLWFLDQLEPGSAMYNVPLAVRLVGDLDETALERALNEVVRRHEVLRTTFNSQGGIPGQVIAPSLALPFPAVDVGPDGEAEARRLLDAEARRPFDLARGPLVRAGLIRLGEGESIVHITMHHIASDGWSMGVLVREIAALYEAFHRGEPSPLPDLPVQYADYAAWQRDWLQGENLRVQLDYWRDHLSGAPTLELPTDRPRPTAMSGRGGERTIVLPPDLATAVRSLGRDEGSTLFMTLLAAFQVLLFRLSGQPDLVIGTPIAGRTRSETEGLIGFFINTLVLRVDLSAVPTFRELLRRVRQVTLGAYAHQDLPFEQLVSVLHPDRDPARSPLFQVMFALQNAPLPPLESPDLRIEPLESSSGTAKFDLTLTVSETEQGLIASMEYSSDLFEPSTIDGILNRFGILLDGIVSDPDRSLGDLPMMTQEELSRLTGQGGSTEDDLLSRLDDLSDEELDSLLNEMAPGPG